PSCKDGRDGRARPRTTDGPAATRPARTPVGLLAPARRRRSWERGRAALWVCWLVLVAVVQGIGIVLQERITVLVPDTSIQYTTLGALQVAGIVIAVVVQPTVGTLSHYTLSPFGRRTP